MKPDEPQPEDFREGFVSPEDTLGSEEFCCASRSDSLLSARGALGVKPDEPHPEGLGGGGFTRPTGELEPEDFSWGFEALEDEPGADGFCWAFEAALDEARSARRAAAS